jgi:sodium-dependent dicarboxylate transporter 2/3/5
MGVHPYIFMVSATLAASCAFMLPVATPPNAVVFGSGYVSMSSMIRAGLGLNLISILLVTFWVFYLLPYFWAL